MSVNNNNISNPTKLANIAHSAGLVNNKASSGPINNVDSILSDLPAQNLPSTNLLQATKFVLGD